MPDKQVPIYDPAVAPMKGLASYKASSQKPIGSGYFQDINGFRWGDNEILTVRNGSATITANPIGFNWRGAWVSATSYVSGDSVSSGGLYYACFLATSGTTAPGSDATHWSLITVRSFHALTFKGDAGYMALSLKTNSKTSVFLSNTPGTWGASITPNSNQWGDTRLSADVSGNDYPTSYAVVNDLRTGLDCLVVQNGYDFPRVYDGVQTAIHMEVVPPPLNTGWGVRPIANQFLKINDVSTYTVLDLGVDWSLSAGGVGAGHNYLHIGYAATSGFTGAGEVLFISPGSLTVFNGPQLAKQVIITVVGRGANPSVAAQDFQNLFQVKVHGVQSGTNKTLYDPSQASRFGSYGFAAVDGGSTSDGFPIQHLIYSVDPLSLGTPDISFDQISFTPIAGVTVDDTSSLDIVGIVLGGMVAGATEFAVDYYNSASRSSSPQIILPTKPQRLQDQGMRQSLAQLVWPASDLMALQMQLDVAPIDQGQMNTGVDACSVYAKATGETDYFYYGQFQIAGWSGSAWVGTTPNSSTGLLTSSVNLDITLRDLRINAPGAFQAPIPIGRAMTLGTGGRLIVGGRSLTQDSFPRVCESRSTFPFRFSFTPNLADQSTAFEDSVNGENIVGFIAAAASFYAAATTYMFTDKAVWIVDPLYTGTQWFIRRVGSFGCGASGSLIENRGRIYFLDTNIQVRLIDGAQDSPISLGWINDKLVSIPVSRLGSVVGAWYNFRYYMARSIPAGTTNTKVIIYSENATHWESDDVLPTGVTAEGMLVHHPSTVAANGAYNVVGPGVLLMLGSDARIYQYETGVDDVGQSGVSVSLLTGDTQNFAGSLTFRRISVLADGVNGQWTWTREYDPKGGSSVSLMNLVNTNPQNWLYDKTPVLTGEGLGVAGRIRGAGTFPGGTQHFSIRVELEARDGTAKFST